MCSRNIHQYVLQQWFSPLNIFLWEFSSRQNPKSEQQELEKWIQQTSVGLCPGANNHIQV